MGGHAPLVSRAARLGVARAVGPRADGRAGRRTAKPATTAEWVWMAIPFDSIDDLRVLGRLGAGGFKLLPH